LINRANKNAAILVELVPQSSVVPLEIFAPDNAVIGGRTAVSIVNRVSLAKVTDVLVDFSALSIGVAFPLVCYLLEKAASEGKNLHLTVTDEPRTDAMIESISSDAATTIHGFKGGWGLEENSKAAKLWMPQLARNKRAVLDRIHQTVAPNAVCPILPFPAANPRTGDELLEHYHEEFANTWQVDARDVVYASERGPLDLYRTILRMDDARRRVFLEVGGSQIILSPVGSKALAIGALMAALERREFTIMYVESLGYTVDFAKLDQVRDVCGDIVHVWLHGEAYGQPSRKDTAS
jgi:hypothetical protein